MTFLLDTNAVIAILKGDEVMLRHLRQHHPADFGLSAVVAHELFYGAYKSRRVEANLGRIEGLRFEMVALDYEDARCAGAIRARLATARTPIGPYDSLIAGQAVARDLIVVTHNTKEFQQVDGLRFEDWMS